MSVKTALGYGGMEQLGSSSGSLPEGREVQIPLPQPMRSREEVYLTSLISWESWVRIPPVATIKAYTAIFSYEKFLAH